MGWKQTAYHINSDPGHAPSKQQLDKNLKITFASPSKGNDQKEKEKKKRKAIAMRFALHADAKQSKRSKNSQTGFSYHAFEYNGFIWNSNDANNQHVPVCFIHQQKSETISLRRSTLT